MPPGERMTAINNTKDAMAQARARMEKAVEDFRRELASIRTGRANVALLDSKIGRASCRERVYVLV